MSNTNTTAVADAAFGSQATFVLGCQLASLIIDNFLAGVLFMQVATYFWFENEDKWWTKGVVIWAAILNTVVTIYYWVYLQYLFVQHWGDWTPWLESRWLANMPLLDSITISGVQGFFAYRAFLLMGRNHYILGVIGVLMLAQFGAAIGVVFDRIGTELLAGETGPELLTWLISCCLADCIISCALFFGLWRSRTGFAQTDASITKLIKLTFECQLLPTCLAVAYIVEWSIKSTSMLGAVFQAVASKAYAVGLLFSLNARISPPELGMTSAAARGAQVFALSSRHRPTDIQIEVATETYIHGEATQHEREDKDDSSDYQTYQNYNNGSVAKLTQPEQV
ncbi:hypothetical protein Q5752_004131 [Cryptotrichosporon argae]